MFRILNVALLLVSLSLLGCGSAISTTGATTEIARTDSTPASYHPPFIPAARITITIPTVLVIGSIASVSLSCQKREAIRLICGGTITLVQTLTSHDVRACPDGPCMTIIVVPGKSVVLGRARFAIPNCCSQSSHSVRVPLNAVGRALVAHRGRPPGASIKITAVLDHGAAQSTRIGNLEEPLPQDRS